MLASYLLDATRSGHPLEDLALEHLGYKALTEEDLCGRGVKAIAPAELPPSAILDYAGERADLALQLADQLQPLLASEQLEPRLPRSRDAAHPGARGDGAAGVRMDAAALAAQSQHVEHELAMRAAQIYRDGRRASSTSTRRSSSRDPVREAAAAGAEAQRARRERRRPPSRCSRSWRCRTICRG